MPGYRKLFRIFVYSRTYSTNSAQWVQNWPLEREAEKLIAGEDTLEKRASGKRPQKKTLEQLSQIHEKVDMAIQEYDLLRILFCWLVELTGSAVIPSRMHVSLLNGCCQKWKLLSLAAQNFLDKPKRSGKNSRRYCPSCSVWKKVLQQLPGKAGFRWKPSTSCTSRKLSMHLPGNVTKWNTALVNFLETAMDQQGRNSTTY